MDIGARLGLSVALLLGCVGGDGPEPDAGRADAGSDGAECSPADFRGCIYAPREYSVSQVDGYTVRAPSYDREFPIRVRHPIEVETPLPVVLVSHGGTFNDDGHEELEAWGEVLAAAGYAAIHLAHVYPEVALIERICEEQSVPADECVPDGSYNPATVLRSVDAIATLDDLEEISAWLEAMTGARLDPSRVATLGWSGGSQTGLALLGSRRDLSPSVRFQLADARVAGAVALSPQGPGFSGYFEDETGTSMDDVRRPVLIATGANDIKEERMELLPAIRRRTYENLPGGNGDQRLLFSELPPDVGNHVTYSRPRTNSSDERLVRLSEALASTTRAFLDALLRDDAAAEGYLDSDAPRTLAGDASWEAR